MGSGDTQAIAALIGDLKAFEKSVTDSGAVHGSDALLGATGALGGEIAAIIKGLQTGDATLVTAAADQMHGNAADAGDHNVPVIGGTYNTQGVTVAEVLGAPVAETATVAETPPAPAPDLALPNVVAPTLSAEPGAVTAADLATPVGMDHDHSRARPNWRIICITRGDSGARRGLPACPMLRGRWRPIYRESAFAGPAHATGAQRHLVGLAPAKGRSKRRSPPRRLGGPIVMQRHRRLVEFGAVAVSEVK